MKLLASLKRSAVLLGAEAVLFGRDEAGQDLIEYALVASLVALAAVASMKNIGVKLAASFTALSSAVTVAI